MKDISDRLHEALAEQLHPTSMAEVARRAKHKPVTVRAYFSGERNPPLHICMDLGSVLGVSGQWLFDGKGPKRLKQSETPSDPRGLVEVPLLDYVTAGKLASPASQIPVHDVPLLAYADLGPGEFFALKVTGSSMDRVSPEGSVVVVNRRDKTLLTGRCYIFAHRGETTYKRWQGNDPTYLEPYSTDISHKPIFIKRQRDLEVIGRVKRTILDL